MIKSIISMILALCMLLTLTFYENIFIKRQFTEFAVHLDAVREKVEDKSANEDDMNSLLSSWIEKKKSLYMFVSHTEIKEFELWVTEAITLVRDKQWADAVSKLEVIKELTKEIPCSFILSIENLL